MIGVKQFKKAIEIYQKHDKILDKLQELSFDVCESPLIDCFWSMQDLVFDISFDEIGKDWINAYLYEDCREYWIEEEHYEINNLDDLWELVKEYRI